jgi:DNA repair protein RadA/Sms
MDRRLAEAARLGFGIAVVPAGVTATPAGLRAHPADNIGTALRVLREISDTDANSGRSEEKKWP